MGAKYTTNASSGYNSSPPSDDGSQVASNLVKWSTQKTKLTDPLKSFIEEVNTDLVAAFDYAVRRITTSDSLVAGDHMRTVEIGPSVSTVITVTLADASTMTNVYRVYLKNSGTKNATIARATGGDTIDGTAGDIILPPSSGIILTTNNAANGYLLTGHSGPFIDTNPLIVGGTDGTKKVRFEVDGLTTGTTRVITVQDQDMTIGLVLSAEQATTSGTSIDFTPIPAWVKRITLQFAGVSTSGTSDMIVQIGDSGGVETTNYLGGVTRLTAGAASQNNTNGFGVCEANDANTVIHGHMMITLQDAASFTWVASGITANSDTGQLNVSGGSKSLSAALDRIRLTTAGGADTFDAGAVSILYEG
jgi:hypothetical protein